MLFPCTGALSDKEFQAGSGGSGIGGSGWRQGNTVFALNENSICSKPANGQNGQDHTGR